MEIPVSQGRVAIIDDEDADIVGRWSWCLLKSKSGGEYAKSNACPFTLMHRLVMNAQKGQIVDHINSRGLDNRKANLRFATHAQNLHNMRKTHGTSRYKGVYWNKARSKWQAQLRIGGEITTCLGRFDREEDAAAAYDEAARSWRGEFAKTNGFERKPPGWTPPDVAGILSRELGWVEK